MRNGFSLEQEPERLDDGTTPGASFSSLGDPLIGPSFWPKVGTLLLAAAIVFFLVYAIANPAPPRERPSSDEPWTPSSGPCEGLTPLECKWN